MFRDISVWHVALILLAFMVLFGYKKLPDATRSLGRSMRILKSEVKGLHDDEPKQVGPGNNAAGPTANPTAAANTAPANPAPVNSAPVNVAPTMNPAQQATPTGEAPRPAEVSGRHDSDST